MVYCPDWPQGVNQAAFLFSSAQGSCPACPRSRASGRTHTRGPAPSCPVPGGLSHRPSDPAYRRERGPQGPLPGRWGRLTHGASAITTPECVSTECISTRFCHQNPHIFSKTKSISQSPLEKNTIYGENTNAGPPRIPLGVPAPLWGARPPGTFLVPRKQNPSKTPAPVCQTTPEEGGAGPEVPCEEGRSGCGLRLSRNQVGPQPRVTPPPQTRSLRMAIRGCVSICRRERTGSGPNDSGRSALSCIS